AGPLIVHGVLDAQGAPGSLPAAAYRPALVTMVGVLAVGFAANLLVRPVPQRYHEPPADQRADETAHRDEDTTRQRSGTR
ncbi:MFS transporter, partial [Micromonospora sp. M51]|nr:MFS transporter [Micromonospora sp. M51]